MNDTTGLNIRENKELMDEKLASLVDELKKEFLQHMIPFWQGLTDNEFGGFYGLLDHELKLDKKADKGCILNSRIMWFFSRAYTVFKEESYLKSAKQAYDFLKNAFIDKDLGGIYWSVSYDGEPQDTMKHSYNFAFAIYGLSAYFEASGDVDALKTAHELYSIVENKLRDADGYFEAYTREFEIAGNEKLSENGVEAARTMNTLLHMMEAYTELYRVGKKAESDAPGSYGFLNLNDIKQKIHAILDIFRNKMFNPDKERLEVFFDKDYNTLIDLHSFGHDIESAWLIDRTVEVLGDAETEYDMSDITEILTRKIYDVAYDGTSVPAESENGKVLETRIWWVQSESIVGFMNGFERSGNTDYLEATLNIWKYVKNHMVDIRRGSEWFSDVDINGKPVPDMPIADPWKCPYHNGRMFLEILERVSSLK